MVTLREISNNNLEAVLSLEVWDHQKSFVSSTAHALAQAYVNQKTAFPFAIYTDDCLVGFIMLGYYEARKQYTLWKFLIDRRYQNQGYGREALMQGIRYLQKTFHATEIYTGVSLGNDHAKHLYLSIGFQETGLIEDHMEELRYICSP